jgi:hypothetical protein
MTYVEDEVGATLVAAGYATECLRYYRWDEAKNEEILIIPGGGSGLMTSSGDVQEPRVQVQVRAKGGDSTAILAAKEEMWAIIRLLHGSTTIDGIVYCLWDLREPDFWTDENNRGIFSAEFKITRCVT